MLSHAIFTQVIDTGKPFDSQGRIGKLVAALKNTLNENKHSGTEFINKDNSALLPLIKEALTACTENYMKQAPDAQIKAQTFMAKARILESIIKNPNNIAGIFQDAALSTTDQFNELSRLLYAKLMLPTVYTEISLNDVTQSRNKFAHLNSTVDMANALLKEAKGAEIEKLEDLNLLKGKLKRREIEIPLLEELLTIRIDLNHLEQSHGTQHDTQKLRHSVQLAVVKWQSALDMVDVLTKRIIENLAIEGVVKTPGDQVNLDNYHQIAVRISNIISALNSIFSQCNKLSRSDMEYLSSKLQSVRVSARPMGEAKQVAKASAAPAAMFNPQTAFDAQFKPEAKKLKDEMMQQYVLFKKTLDDHKKLNSVAMKAHGINTNEEWLNQFRCLIDTCMIGEGSVIKLYKDETHFDYCAEERYDDLRKTAMNAVTIHPGTNLPVYKVEKISYEQYCADILAAFTKRYQEKLHQQFNVDKEPNLQLKAHKKASIENAVNDLRKIIDDNLKATATLKHFADLVRKNH